MNHRLKETAISNTKTFFSKTTADFITLDEAFEAWGRDMKQVEQNKSWFSNKLTDLKYHGLVKPVYTTQRTSRGVRRLLVKVELTMEGKKAIGRLNEEPQQQPITYGTPANPNPPDAQNGHSRPLDHYDPEREMSIPEVMKVVAKLRRDHPEFEITFDIKLKDSAESSGTV